MRARGALHVHSVLSHDGKMTLAEIAHFYREREYSFVAIGEHSQDMNPERCARLVDECASLSDGNFLMVPGVEFTCIPRQLHVLGVGTTALTAETDPVRVAGHVRGNGGFCVLAHPKRIGWDCASDLLNSVDAVELWNVGYDGKFLPSVQGPVAFERMRQSNPQLLAVASHDLHHPVGFYNVATEVEVRSLTAGAVVAGLRAGQYRIVSRWFQGDAHGNMRRSDSWRLRLMGSRLAQLRKARARVLGWCT